MSRVFLGGTCNDSSWRDSLIKDLKIDYFDPVVEDWTEEARLNEEKGKADSSILLYVITPDMRGFYSIAELCVSALDDDGGEASYAGYRREVIFCPLKKWAGKEFDDGQWSSLLAVGKLLGRTITFLEDLESLVVHLNKYEEVTND